jgi:biopolymer transport protein ExbD
MKYISLRDYLKVKHFIEKAEDLKLTAEPIYCTHNKSKQYYYVHFEVTDDYLKAVRTHLKKYALFETLKNNNVTIKATKSLKYKHIIRM